LSKFPIALLQTDKGLFGPHPLEGYFIRIPIAAFSLESETVDTALRLDCVVLPTSHLQALSGSTLSFPTNPDDGFIDGSIYIGSGHHPIDVHEIKFAVTDGNSIQATITCEIDFEFEGLYDFEKTAWKFEALLEWTDKPQHA
jgi:hypothetical protein